MEYLHLLHLEGKGPAASRLARRAALHARWLDDARRPAHRPLRDRFGIIGNLGFYDKPGLEPSARRSASILKIPTAAAGAAIRVAAAAHSRIDPPAAAPGPRLRRGKGDGTIDSASAVIALESLDVDAEAWTRSTGVCLKALIENFDGGFPSAWRSRHRAVPKSLDTLTD